MNSNFIARLFVMGIVAHTCIPALWAGISYQAESNIVRVVGFPAGYPCTPAHLAAMDRACGWGRVTYDQTTGCYAVNANLQIGNDEGSETYFQIGCPARPGEILRVNGNVVVAQGERPQPAYRASEFTTRLTLGSPDDPAIRGALQIESGPGREHSLGVSGQLHVYNSRITAAIQDAPHAISAAWMNADSVILSNATLSWIAGFMTYYARQSYDKQFEAVNSVFEHGGIALVDAGTKTIIRGCMLRDLQNAVVDRGSLDLVFVDCVFTNNQSNWRMTYTPQGLTCIDCQIAPSLKGDVLTAWRDPKTGLVAAPSVTRRRHVIVEVTDAMNKPVTNAEVRVTCEQAEPDRADNPRVTVDAAGRTPGRESPRALLLTESIHTGALDGKRPDERTYTYTIKAAAAADQSAAVTGFKPTNSWPVVRLVIETR